jgi:hypothetical protein
VYNSEAGRLRITAACRGNDGVINRDGAELLARLSAHGDSALDRLSHGEARFLFSDSYTPPAEYLPLLSVRPAMQAEFRNYHADAYKAWH